MSADETNARMSEEGRALLTDGERKVLTGEKDAKDNYQYKVQSLVRTRVRRRFGDDIEILEEHFPEVYGMIEEAVCDG